MDIFHGFVSEVCEDETLAGFFLHAYHQQFYHEENTRAMYQEDRLLHIERMLDAYITGEHNSRIDAALTKKPKKPSLSDKYDIKNGDTFLARLRSDRWQKAINTLKKSEQIQQDEAQKIEDVFANIMNQASKYNA